MISLTLCSTIFLSIRSAGMIQSRVARVSIESDDQSFNLEKKSYYRERRPVRVISESDDQSRSDIAILSEWLSLKSSLGDKRTSERLSLVFP